MSDNDLKIKEFRSKIEAKRAEMGEKPRLHYITNGVLVLDAQKMNLNTLRDEMACVDVASQLIARQNALKQANELLGTNVALKIGNYTIDEWLEDIRTRITLLKWTVQEKQLKQMDDQLAELLSNDAKTADAIDKIVGMLD